jgi:hypothetical protein
VENFQEKNNSFLKAMMSRQSDNVLFYQNRNVLFWEC